MCSMSSNGNVCGVVYVYNEVINLYLPLSLQEQSTPLTMAAVKGHTNIVDMLLAKGADVNHAAIVS